MKKRKNRKNMATTHPNLIKWFASKNPFFVFIKILPLVAVFSWFILQSKTEFTIGILFFIFGMITWSFFEYATHRWVYHTIFKNKNIRWFFDAFHLHHHHNLKDYRVLNAGLFTIYPLAFFFWLMLYIPTHNTALSSCFSIGVLSYYFFYENIHYFIHYKVYKNGYMKFIQKYHLYHHYKKWNKNYGNTITLWDKLLGTYDGKYKELEITETMMNDLIYH